MPVATRARDKAHETACLSNVRQVGMAMMMYAADNDEILCPTRLNKEWIWPHFVYPYVHNQELFICPTARLHTYTERWERRGELSYGLNRHLEHITTYQPRGIYEFEQSSRTIMFADSTCGPTTGPDRRRGYQIREDRAPDTRSGISSRHDGQANIAFLDGHARSYVAEEVVPAMNEAGLWWFPSPSYGPCP